MVRGSRLATFQNARPHRLALDSTIGFGWLCGLWLLFAIVQSATAVPMAFATALIEKGDGQESRRLVAFSFHF